ncbi:MAG TPA: thioredoxin domain-containing protein, partial [Streptosporangiaceae bacterium]|nr:thioredoxin domain-containing protein [Streptosporangiaceae bacterium]
MAERLRNATSPYLLQHADNPVDWWPWGDEAFAAARDRGVPVLLSVGYSACHWCHVMAHESFEDDATAALMNENLVSIKVDREERPDVDAVYMTATQIMTNQGGWPMTVFMTPDREPFYCGTYFTRDQLQHLVATVADAWRKDQGAVTGQAKRIAGALAEQMAGGGHGEAPAAGALASSIEAAVTGLQGDYDARLGGFGGAPKFPPSMVLEFLLRHRERDGGPSGESALRMAAGTLEAMARGGMYDQLAGGFARYSVDAGWVVPHFEKMLYDNAQLVGLYARWDTALGDRVAGEAADWLLREMLTEQGGLASALDADSEGEEGRFYVWTPEQLTDVLGADDGRWAVEVFGVTGTFEHGTSTLRLPADPEDADRLDDVRRRLLAARELRVRPARDDKVVAAWNGLAIGGLVDAGRLLGRERYVEAALAAGELLAEVHLVDDRLRRVSRDGRVGTPRGTLEDHGAVASGFLSLCGATGDERWLER